MCWRDHATATVDDLTGTVESTLETVGDIVADVLETAGNAAHDALGRAGKAGWIGDVLAGVMNCAGAVAKGAFDLVGGTVTGVLRLLGGLLLLNADLLIKGSLSIGASVSGALILSLGTFLALIQRVFFLQISDRPLTKRERAMLERVFHRSLSFFNVRIVDGRSGLFGINNRPFVLGNVIYLKDRSPSIRPDILVHECVHIWQYQTAGTRYAAEALGAQAIYGRGAYDWQAEIERGRAAWPEFNREAQAQLIQDIWTEEMAAVGSLLTAGSGGFIDQMKVKPQFGTGNSRFIFRGIDYTHLARSSMTSLRRHDSRRWSRSL